MPVDKRAKSMIVAAQPEASEAGAQVLARGGNAIDAAMTAALVQGVVDPQMCGIAGFGSCQIYMPKRGIHTCIDFHGKTPLAAKPDMWADLVEGETRDGFGFVLKGNANDLGYQAVTAPGSLKAYHEAVSEFGTFDWSDICAPAIADAKAGFVVRPHVYYWWTSGSDFGRVNVTDRLRFSKTGAKAYFREDGSVKRVGDRVVNPDLATTLERIAEYGPDIFYSGEIAEQIAADFASHGGLLTLADLKGYATRRIDPIAFDYRGYSLTTNHPPGGGIMVTQMLNTLEHFDLVELGHNSAEYIRVVSEAMKAATSDKDAHVGDPAFHSVPLERLTSKAYAAQLAQQINRGERFHVDRIGMPEPKHTTHVAVIDGEGNAVTMTHSLGMPSGVITDGLGFMYNGCMAVFDPRPGRAGSIAPGKARFSSLCPTLAFKDGQLRLAIGAPGGTQIAMGVTQAIINVIDHDMSMTEAVSAPRFSSTSNLIDVTNRIPRYIQAELEADGYQVFRKPNTFDIAAVHGIRVTEEGWLDGGADPGHDGVAIGV
jgi:gamma-glutamyltranspeptidase/glutathione hydrolase